MLNDTINKYTYDAKNRLTSVTAPGNLVTNYVYGADGARVEKQTPSGNIYYDHDFDGSLAATYTLSGTTLTATTEDVWLNGGHLGFIGGTANAAMNLSALDWVGSVRTRVDPSGNIISADRNLPFGEGQTEFISGWGDQDDTIHFTGKERDAESGLDNFGARYSSTMGRFMSPDWSEELEAVPYGQLSNPQSLNLYAYARNNPLSLVDPDGHENCSTSSLDGKVFSTNCLTTYTSHDVNPDSLEIPGNRKLMQPGVNYGDAHKPNLIGGCPLGNMPHGADRAVPPLCEKGFSRCCFLFHGFGWLVLHVGRN